MIMKEKGSLFTMNLAASANKNTIPPISVFANRNYRDRCIANGPEGGAVSANMSGQMTGGDFLLFMKHFIKHTTVTKDRRVLPLPDKHVTTCGTSTRDLRGKCSGVTCYCLSHVTNCNI
jgi:hypothetical protein